MSWKPVAILVLATFVTISIRSTHAQDVPLNEFQKYAKDLKQKWFGHQGNAYLLLAYMDDVAYTSDKFDVSNRNHFCGKPDTFLRSRPEQSQEDKQRWGNVGDWKWIAENRLKQYDYFEKSRDASGMRLPVNDN